MPQKYKVLPGKKPIAAPQAGAGTGSIPASGSPLTVISGGPFIGVQTGGKVMVRSAAPEERAWPIVAAFLSDSDCGQMVAAWAGLGITRDYRKATIEQVCASLDQEGTLYVKANTVLNGPPPK